MPASVAALGPVAPVLDIFSEPAQVRVKVQSFTHCPPEVTLRVVDHGREVDSYFRAYHRALPVTSSGDTVHVVPRTKKPRDPDAPRNPENVHRAMCRRKSKLRLTIKELAPNAFVTLTSRALLTSLDLAYAAYAEWLRLTRKHYGDAFAAVVVPEWHKSGGHLHLHIAARIPGGVRAAIAALRFFWHRALCKVVGLPIPPAPLRGADSPGNIDLQTQGLRGKSDLERVNRIARYMGKYLTKEMVVEFGRKAYSPTRNVELAAARIFWASELSLEAARAEALRALGYSPDFAPVVSELAPEGAQVRWLELGEPPPH